MSAHPVGLELTDELIVALFERARELGLLPEPESAREWFTAKQAAAELGVSPGRIHSLVSEQRLPRRYKRGHKAVFRREDLDAYQAGGLA